MYAHGRGRVVMRAQVAFEETRSERTAIIVTELPYQVNKAALVEKIADLVKDKKIDGISDLRDESDRDGMRLVIEVKRDANPHKVLNNLFKHTPMQMAFNLNMLALVDGQPQTLPLKRSSSTTSTIAARSSAAGPNSSSRRRAPGRTSSRASRSRSTTWTRSSGRSASRPTSTSRARTSWSASRSPSRRRTRSWTCSSPAWRPSSARRSRTNTSR